MKNTLCNEGIVRKINQNDVIVEITVRSACSNCHSKAMCSSFSLRQDMIHAKAIHPDTLKVGDKVIVSMQQSMGGKAIAIGYFLPLIVMVFVLVLSYSISKNELLSVALALAFTGSYFLILWLLGKKIDKQFVFYVEKEPEINVN